MSEIAERHYLRNGAEALPGGRGMRSRWGLETRAAMVDLKFCDLLGTWQHVSLPIPLRSARAHSTRDSASTDRRSAAGRRSRTPTCC